MYKSFNNVDDKNRNKTGQTNVIDVKPADLNNEKPPLEVRKLFHYSN